MMFAAAAAVLAQEAPADGAKADSSADAAKPAAPAADAKAKPPVKLLPPRVRTGTIVKAEFTSEKPEAEGESAVSKKSSPAWAVLTIKLDPGRAVSVFDYVLSKDGTEYPCLDLAEGNEPFAGKQRIYASVESKTCRLVFGIPSAEDEYEIIFKLFAEEGSPAKLNVKPPPPPPEKKPEEGDQPGGGNKEEQKFDDGKQSANPVE
jgi:hypothetical protein